MHIIFVLGDAVSKHVWVMRWHERPLWLKPQSMEIPSAQKVIHVESFSKVCEALNKVHNAQRIDWDLCIQAVLWAYRTVCKNLTTQEPLRLEYEVRIVIPI